ncbi:potassium transporter TrkA [Streptomyces broussonetiae]|uniref:Potassium transporter TrkA n=1 Tax=Streptomyces broussonetiae TaxID=2686304 RepID=A0A6I6MQ27_9ACTN|nr:potassium transporter TrkA [Streptomyces broussonetiae]QHA02363.1 potassium transporter TrkA [Streptomyces broussonetiae]
MTATAPAGIVVLGGGSLARSICYSLAVAAQPQPGTVTVLARSVRAADEIACIASARAATSASTTRFTAEALDVSDRGAVAGVLLRIRPRVVINCASMQSPWESTRAPSAWTALLTAGGFGIGLPLHAVLAREAAHAIQDSGSTALFVNACYPDAVNPLLHAEGLPVFCGVGNSATLSASLHAAVRPQNGERLRVLAHHAHLYAPAHPSDEARVWLDDRPLEGVGELLAGHRACSREELNAVTGHTAAVLAARLAAGAEVRADLPGPLGLPGGYPVHIHGDLIALDLPDGLTTEDAVAWQMRMAERDGVVVTPSGDVRFGERARHVLSAQGADIPRVYEAQDMEALARQLLGLREKLRAVPTA